MLKCSDLSSKRGSMERCGMNRASGKQKMIKSAAAHGLAKAAVLAGAADQTRESVQVQHHNGEEQSAAPLRASWKSDWLRPKVIC